MAQSNQWAFPESLQPSPEETQFDLARAMDCMVLVRVEVPDDAFTAGILGTERGGYGIVIREDGLGAYARGAGWAESQYNLRTGKLPLPGKGRIDLSHFGIRE